MQLIDGLAVIYSFAIDLRLLLLKIHSKKDCKIMSSLRETPRTVLGKQSAKVLLVDLCPPFSSEVGEELCGVLENLFSVACNFTGPTRIPFFSMLALRGTPELVLPFSYVKNNLPRIQTCIADVKSMILNIDPNHKPNPCVYQGLAEACTQFRRQLQSNLQSGGICDQMEAVIVTCQNGATMLKQVETATASLDLQHVRKIQVLSIASFVVMFLDDISVSEDTASSQTSALSGDSFGSSGPVSGIVELLNVEPDVLCLQNYFNTWLLEPVTDCEHMHLILPPATEDGASVIVKCDVHERIIHPAQLPFYSQFTVHRDSFSMKMLFPSTSKAMVTKIPIYHLVVTSLIPITSVCDSVVFGMPVVAQATACWKLDWEDLEKNQQVFKALCSSLVDKDQALIAQLQPEADDGQKSRRGTKQQQGSKPVGNFVLIPAEDGTMLVKCLAVQELMLPFQAKHLGGEPSEECIERIAQSLNQVELVNCYNPLTNPSKLYECLRGLNRKPQAQTKTLEKQTPVLYTNKIVSSKTTKPPNQSSSTHDTPLIEDTPLAKRLSTKGRGRGTRRLLYTEASEKFMAEPEDEVFIESFEEGVTVQTFRSGQPTRVKSSLFPTSL